MKLNALLIDDDADSRLVIASYLQKYREDICLVGEGGTVQEGLGLVNRHAPELLLLDIQLTDGTAFDLLSKTENKNFEVIFITAYDTYAIEAFRFSAIDYLLKPISFADLNTALGKARDRIQQKHFMNHWETLSHNLQQMSNAEKRLAIATSEGYIFKPVRDIVRLEASSNYTHFYFTAGEKIVSSHTLGYYEELLPQEKFCRVHNSHLVNIDWIDKYVKGGAGGSIIMKGGLTLDVSQRKKEKVITQLTKSIHNNKP